MREGEEEPVAVWLVGERETNDGIGKRRIAKGTTTTEIIGMHLSYTVVFWISN